MRVSRVRQKWRANACKIKNLLHSICMVCGSIFSPCDFRAANGPATLATPSTVTHHQHKRTDKKRVAIQPNSRIVSSVYRIRACHPRCWMQTYTYNMRKHHKYVCSVRGDYSANRVLEMFETHACGLPALLNWWKLFAKRERERRRLCLRLFDSSFNLHNLAMKNNGFNNVRTQVTWNMGFLSTRGNIFDILFLALRDGTSRASTSTRVDNEWEQFYSMALRLRGWRARHLEKNMEFLSQYEYSNVGRMVHAARTPSIAYDFEVTTWEANVRVEARMRWATEFIYFSCCCCWRRQRWCGGFC